MASDHNNLSHSLKTPIEVLEIARSYQGQAVEVSKKKSCGCNKRKKWLNSKVPGLGTAVEWLTIITGIKWAVNRWNQ